MSSTTVTFIRPEPTPPPVESVTIQIANLTPSRALSVYEALDSSTDPGMHWIADVIRSELREAGVLL